MLLSFLSFANRSDVVQHELRKKAFWIFKCVWTVIYYYGRRKWRGEQTKTNAYKSSKTFFPEVAFLRKIHIITQIKYSMHVHAVLKQSIHCQTHMTLTGYSRSVGIFVGMFHVLHKSLSTQEHLVTQRTWRSIRTSDKSRMLLQPTNTLLTKVRVNKVLSNQMAIRLYI